VALAYVVALQIILSGFASGHLVAAGDLSSSGVFITCLGHAGGSDSDQGGSGQRPVDQAPCVLCTLAMGACAILPAEHGVSTIAILAFSHVIASTDDQVAEFVSPTGQYQRGPPAEDFAAG
jgi:hypothetical protein